MFEHYYYLLALLVSLAGLAILDHHYKLALFYERVRTLKVLGLSVAIFMVWDLLGVGLGIFYVGPSSYISGIRLAPEVPIEELFFLTLLAYNTLLLWRGSQRLWPRT